MRWIVRIVGLLLILAAAVALRTLDLKGYYEEIRTFSLQPANQKSLDTAKAAVDALKIPQVRTNTTPGSLHIARRAPQGGYWYSSADLVEADKAIEKSLGPTGAIIASVSNGWRHFPPKNGRRIIATASAAFILGAALLILSIPFFHTRTT